MASAQSVAKFFANNKVDMYSHIPGDTAANDVGWVDMAGYEGVAVLVLATNLTGDGVNAFSLLANTAAAGGGTDGTIKSHAVGSAPDASGDYLVLECTAEEMAQLGAAASSNFVGFSASVTHANNADESTVVYIRYNGKWSYDGLTADSVA